MIFFLSDFFIKRKSFVIHFSLVSNKYILTTILNLKTQNPYFCLSIDKTISVIELFQEQGVFPCPSSFNNLCTGLFKDEEATDIAIIIILFDTQLKQQKKFCKTFALRVVEGPCFFPFPVFLYIKDLKQIFWNGLFKQLWWNETCEVVVRYAPWCHFIVRYDSKYFKEREKKIPQSVQLYRTICASKHESQSQFFIQLVYKPHLRTWI